MKEPLKISDFYKELAPSYAAGDNIRKIASYIDGCKLSARKIIYTLFEKFPTDLIKTAQFANFVAAYTCYNQGEQNLPGVISGLVQELVDVNNFALIQGKGGFGNRLDSASAAPRYTHIKAHKNLNKFFNKLDREIVGQQVYEGSKIEPKFYLPILPMILVNGAEGLSTGFSQKILPRHPKDIVTYISKKMKGVKNPTCDFIPWFKGFKGEVYYNEDGKLEIIGKIEKQNTTTYIVQELPISLSYSKYCEILETLVEDKIIQDYFDKCNPKTDEILFEIKTTREFSNSHKTNKEVLKALKLIKPYTELLNCIDENNRVREFSSVKEIIDAFIEMRVGYYDKRKEYLITETRKLCQLLYSKYLFVKGVVSDEIKVRNISKDKIIQQLEKIDKIITKDDTYNYLLNIPISNITKDGLIALKEEIVKNKNLLDEYKAMDVNSFWLEDVNQLKDILSNK